MCLHGLAHAQWYKGAFPALTKKVSSSRLGPALERKTSYAHHQTQLAREASLKLIRDYDPQKGSRDDHLSSAFVIVENIQGTPRKWGVTVQHYDLNTRPAVEHSSLQRAFPIEVLAAGQRRYSDVAIFPLPAPLEEQVSALKLADTEPQPGEEVSSYGYYNGGFQELHHRLVEGSTPARLVTSYEFGPSVEKIGACGGPVLNARDEVVGIHCGSLAYQNRSFAVPVAHIYRLLRAYYSQNAYAEPLVFNGQKIYDLKVNQAVRQAIAWREREPVQSVVFHSSSCPLEPAHLEKMFSAADIDQIVLYIDQTDFATNQELPSFQLVYDVKTGKVEKKEL